MCSPLSGLAPECPCLCKRVSHQSCLGHAEGSFQRGHVTRTSFNVTEESDWLRGRKKRKRKKSGIDDRKGAELRVLKAPLNFERRKD